jgi:hypothetical protein
MDLENIVDAAAHKPAMGLTANMSKDVTKKSKNSCNPQKNP